MSDQLDIDILLYIAMAEEFQVVSEQLESELRDRFEVKEMKGVAAQVFSINVPSPKCGRNFRLAVLPAGKMGIKRAGTLTTEILAMSNCPDVVVLGIAGSLSNDLQPGDVFIPHSVVDYLANSAAKNKGKAKWFFETSGDDLPTSPRLLNRFQLLKNTNSEIYAEWERECLGRHKSVATVKLKKRLKDAGFEIRNGIKLFAGDDQKLASGPAVGKGDAFVNWLRREVDRKATAIEMESAGVYDAVQIRIPQPRVIAIRGISDFADERKKILEDSAKGRFREVAAQNALSLLLRGIEAGVFAAEKLIGQTAPGQTGELPVASLVRSVFVIGGVTTETTDVDAETPKLSIACHELGQVIARSGAELIICSPFPNSADYYTALGFASESGDRVMHFHSPDHPDVAKKRQLLGTSLAEPGLKIIDWLHPGPENADGWREAWSLAQIQALERADAVIAVGGKVSASANTLLHLAESKGVPIVPFTFLKGAAERAFKRRNWSKLNPGINTAVLEESKGKGVKRAIEIANQLILESVTRRAVPERLVSVFISRSSHDAEVGEQIAMLLKHEGIDCVFGDAQIRPDQMVAASIEQAIRACEVCIILWSKSYALSPWCYDELIYAEKLQALGRLGIWFLNLDGSQIVPHQGRKQRVITAKSNAAVLKAIKGLLAGKTTEQHNKEER